MIRSQLDLLDALLAAVPGNNHQEKQRVFATAAGALGPPGGAETGGLVITEGGGFQVATATPDANSTSPAFVSDHEIRTAFGARFGALPTDAELSLLKGLLCGETLREISYKDQVSYDTRRNQLAALREKSRVQRQANLVMIMSVILVNVARSREQSELARDWKVAGLLRRHYDPDFRVHSPFLPSGRHLLVADVGPLDGRPIVFVHSSFYPVLPLPNNTHLLQELGVRVLAPIRSGHFGVSFLSKNPADALKHYAEDVSGFTKVFNLSDAPMVAHASGCVFALAVRHETGGKNAKLVLSSPPYYARATAKRDLFQNAWAQLCTGFPHLIEPLIRQMLPRFLSVETFIGTLERAYAQSAPDLAILAQYRNHEWYRDLLRHVASHSAIGLRDDFVITGANWLPSVDAGMGPLHFVFGAQDPFSDHQYVAKNVAEAGADVSVFPDFGQDTAVFEARTLLKLALGE